MRFRVGVLALLAATIASHPLFAPTAATCRMRACPDELFDPVFGNMDQPVENGGCIGCNIRDDPKGFGPRFGYDKDTVLHTLLTGETPDGDVLDPIPTEGGANSILSRWLHNGT